jgi:hypothetical protein
MAGDSVVSGVEEELGKESEYECGSVPRAAELGKHEESGGGAGEQEFVCLFVCVSVWTMGVRIDDDVDRIQMAGVKVVTGEDAGGKGALQRCETESGIAVAAKDELDEAVAESADAVVEEDRVGHVNRSAADQGDEAQS